MEKLKETVEALLLLLVSFGVGVAGYFHREIYLAVAIITGLVFFGILCYALFAEHMEKERRRSKAKNKQRRNVQ